MSFANACVSMLLRSPFHRLLSGSTDLIRYRGRRTGREVTLATQHDRERLLALGMRRGWLQSFDRLAVIVDAAPQVSASVTSVRMPVK